MQLSIHKSARNESVKGDIEEAHSMLHLKVHLKVHLRKYLKGHKMLKKKIYLTMKLII